MKEFIDKLIGRLEEEAVEVYRERKPHEQAYFGLIPTGDKDILLSKAKKIINELAEEYNNSNDSMEIQIAKNYAKCLVKYGVDIRGKWETATSQSMALEQAYLRGRQDERDRFAEWQDNGGWIPCSSGCYSTSEVLVCKEDGTIDFDVYDFMDNDWKFNSNCHKNKVLAWQPLPEPYKAEEPQWKQAMMNTFLARK